MTPTRPLAGGGVQLGDTEAVSPAAHDLSDAALAADLAADAGELLLEVRKEVGFNDPWQLGDAGDARANSLLVRRLRAARPDDAVLSEEAHDDLVRLKSDRVWIIDPLDGTREFSTRGRDDWAVHVALWQRTTNGRPRITDAAVSLPARGNVVYRSDTVTADAAPVGIPDVIRVAVSATRPPAVLHRMRQTLDIDLVRIGSAGAKAMAVIDGYADAYLHAGGQWEWDSAAPAGVVLAAGMHASRLDGSPLQYNQLDPYLPDLLMCRIELAPILLRAAAPSVR
ncbi:3'(2'),5'-bisphosphate nucleotidase CysQ [Mycobacterium simiae]|uniref:3'(2'),5-bisphosphonucleoside 3'(2')-phosphohydrolase n=1 Tax=Mycobacterium simiae TaxID=1784 RepID=A0A5B1BQW6_MYCSI|nr:inositol monophosphatase family protein [Mycobacterium simiae]KAA1249753.1 3'(2'),5'-bisphosphate nucleotidase CysQ [Mycobacterium simiae]